MASDENSQMGLGEMEELEVFEIDGALLRELLEEQEEENETGGDEVECIVEYAENGNNKAKKMMENEQEQQQQQQRQKQKQQSCLDDFEWLNMMEMEPSSLNDMALNWYPEDMVGMVDFGYTNGECYSQICEGLVSYEASYGCLWQDM